MSNYTISPNMNLILPIPGTDPGPDYANNQNASITLIDQHNHAAGNGVQINPNGLNINSDLPFGGNNATLLRSLRLSPQASALSGAADIGCLYETGSAGDLYYNNASGTQIQITKNGLINATSSGISSGTATASFVAGVLVVNVATLTPANIQCASILMGNNVASSNYLTLEPPSAMSSNFTITLPSIPSALSSMTLDTSGNMGSISFDQVGVNMTSVGSNAIANYRTRTVSSTAPLGGVANSSSSGGFSTTSTSYTPVTNLSVSIVTSGRPVFVVIVPDGSGTDAFMGAPNGLGVALLRNGSIISQMDIYNGVGSGTNSAWGPPYFVDVFAGAGTNTYSISLKNVGMNSAVMYYYKLVAFEL